MRLLVCLVIAVFMAAGGRAVAEHARVVAELRDRREHPQAARYGADRWQRDDLPERERAELAIQLALVYTEQALAAPAGSRDALWTKADEACAALIDGWPDNPRRPLVEVQRGLVSLARGRQAREAAHAAAEPGALADALEHLRAATRRLTEIADALGRKLIELRLRPNAARSPDALSVEELESLERHLALHLARAQRELGLCYPPRSADRDDALLQAVRRLTPLAQPSPPDELAWEARIELAACQRDLGRAAQAQALVAAWMRDDPPPHIAAQLSAEPQAVTIAGSEEAAALTLQAEHLYLAGQIDQAIATYDRAAREFQQQGQHEQAFSATMAAATVERAAADRHAAAAERYRQLALQQPSAAQAAEAHRLAILSHADALRHSGAALEQTAAYEPLLREHLDHWSAHATADEVRLWLGQLLAARRDWKESVAILQHVNPSSASFAESVRLTVECYSNQLQALDIAQRRALIAAATQHLQPIITGPDNRWPDTWSTQQLEIALAIGRLHLEYAEGPSPYAERLLSAALQGAASVDDGGEEWTAPTRAALVTALVHNGKPAEALAIVPQLDRCPADLLLKTLAALDSLTTQALSAGDRAQQDVGRLALEIAQLVDARQKELDAKALSKLAAYRATALAAVGDRATALAQFADLAAQSTDDGDIQERLATLLSAADSPAELRQALAQWQQVEARSRVGGPRWYRARQARLDLLTRLGENEEAEKLLRLTRLLYPEWESGKSSPE